MLTQDQGGWVPLTADNKPGWTASVVDALEEKGKNMPVLKKRQGVFWLPWAGVLVLFLSAAAMAAIWQNIKSLEKQRYREHTNLARNIAETAKVFILNQQYDYFSEVLKLLKQVSFIDAISVSLEGRTAFQAGNSASGGHRYLVRQPMAYQAGKNAEMNILFSMEEFHRTQLNILAVFALVLVLLALLAWMGAQLFLTHRALVRAEKTKEDMIYSITHDAKQDLQVIQGKLSAWIPKIKSGFPDRKMERDLKLAQESADSINRYLNNFKDQQGMETGKIEILPEKVEVAELVFSVLEAFAEKLHTREIALEVGALARGSVVLGDPQAMKRVLMNLMHNAMKYSPVKSKITVWQETTNHQVRTFVKDQGIGIPEKDWERIFMPYVQLDTRQEGMGLGLATSRRLAEMMGGELQVFASQEGQGATMVVSFPLTA